MGEKTWITVGEWTYEKDERGQYTGWMKRANGPKPGDRHRYFNEITKETRGRVCKYAHI